MIFILSYDSTHQSSPHWFTHLVCALVFIGFHYLIFTVIWLMHVHPYCHSLTQHCSLAGWWNWARPRMFLPSRAIPTPAPCCPRSTMTKASWRPSSHRRRHRAEAAGIARAARSHAPTAPRTGPSYRPPSMVRRPSPALTCSATDRRRACRHRPSRGRARSAASVRSPPATSSPHARSA